MKRHVRTAAAFVAGIAVGSTMLMIRSANAFSQVEIIVPMGTPITTGPTGDIVIFTGRPVGLMPPGDCGFSDLAVQNTVIVDPGGGGATRLSGVLPTEPPMPIAPGTRVMNLTAIGLCTGGDGNVYNKYRGEVL